MVYCLNGFGGSIHKISLYGLGKAIHGENGKLDATAITGHKSCWLDILHEVNMLAQKGVTLRDLTRIKIRNGENTRFWDECWNGGDIFSKRFPRLYALESNKRITVGVKMLQPGLDFSFHRNPRGGVEQVQMVNLVALVQDINLSPANDRWTWALENSSEFTVALARKYIDDKLLPGVGSKTRWVKCVPIKVNVFAWKVKLDALPTRFNVSRRGMNLDSIRCVVYDQGVETTRHLFFSCNMVRQTTRLITRWWSAPHEEFEDYDGWRIWLINLRLPIKNKVLLEGVFYVMWWCLWSIRNKLIFEDKNLVKALFFDDVISKSYNWCRYRSNASFSINDWRKNPQLIPF